MLTGVLALGLLVGACSGDDDDPNAPQAEDVLKVDEGRCLLVDEALPPEVEKLPTIDCDKPHTHEIFATADDTEHDTYPGISVLSTFAEANCYGAFEDYVGISPYFGESSLSITWLVP
ncbi:MAG TPA: septum formation family protein, partial [Ilumatobacteraceae bacterium]|nr:septum formation family protein [Ilumatobacteraceae bacterium]